MNKKENNKIIMLTGMGKTNFLLESVKYGADAFIVKPFQADKLIYVMSAIDKDQIKPDYEVIEQIIQKQYPDLNHPLSQAEIDELLIYSRQNKK